MAPMNDLLPSSYSSVVAEDTVVVCSQISLRDVLLPQLKAFYID